MLYLIDRTDGTYYLMPYASVNKLEAVFDTEPEYVAEYLKNTPVRGFSSFEEAKSCAIALTLSQLKDFRYHELTSKASIFESDRKNPAVTFVSSLGFTVDGDARSIDNISGLVNSLSDSVPFRDHDNVSHDLTHDQLVLLLKEAQANIQSLYAQKWEFKQKIQSLATREEVLAFDISFRMADFSAVK